MTDYDWFSPDGIEAATDAIRDEAKKWYAFSDRMENIRKAMGGMTLRPAAFAVIDVSTVVTTTDQYNAYASTQGWLTNLFQDATTRFNDMGDALRKCADEYDRTDGTSAKSFDTIAKS